MFSRNSDKDGTRPVQPAAQPAAAQARQPMPSPATASGGTASVIGSDLTIVGSGLKIIAQQSLQVDGEVQGDVIGTQVTIGPTGKVTGLVNADRVQVNGTVNGTIRGQDVILSSTAAVEGDIFHGSIMLEQGASFEGRSRRPKIRPTSSRTFRRNQHALWPRLSRPPATSPSRWPWPTGLREQPTTLDVGEPAIRFAGSAASRCQRRAEPAECSSCRRLLSPALRGLLASASSRPSHAPAASLTATRCLRFMPHKLKPYKLKEPPLWGGSVR